MQWVSLVLLGGLVPAGLACFLGSGPQTVQLCISESQCVNAVCTDGGASCTTDPIPPAKNLEADNVCANNGRCYEVKCDSMGVCKAEDNGNSPGNNNGNEDPDKPADDNGNGDDDGERDPGDYECVMDEPGEGRHMNNMPGFEEGVDAPNEVECCQLCAETPKCMGMNFKVSTKMCFLKDKDFKPNGGSKAKGDYESGAVRKRDSSSRI